MKPNTEIPPTLLSVEETSRRLSMAQSTIRDLVRRGQLEGVKAGTRLLIPESAIQAYIANLPRAGKEG